jgi:oxygen-dependent protoporphyrinogen oxidase
VTDTTSAPGAAAPDDAARASSEAATAAAVSPGPGGPLDVVVVGGGVAGLVAARDLALAGRSVVVLEGGPRVGGEVARHTVAGIDLDAGAESFATKGGTVAAFLAELGLGDDVVLPDPRGAWVQHGAGEAFPLPRTGLLGVPGDLGAADVVAVIGAEAAAEAARLDAAPAAVGADELMVGPFVRARMGSAVLDRLVAPIIGGVHSVHPDALPVDRVAPRLRRALQEEGSLAAAVRSVRALAPAGSAVAGLRGGMARLVDALVADLGRLGVRVRLDSPVVAVDARSATLATGERLVAEHVLLAVGDGAARALAGRRAPEPGLITLATIVLRDDRLDAGPRGTGVLVAPGAVGVRAKALTHGTVKWPWLAEAAGGRHVLRLSYDSPVVDAATPDGELRRVALADASTLLGVDLDERSVEGTARVVWDAPLPQEAPDASPSPLDDVVRVGGAVAGRGLAAVIARSRRAAAELLPG